MRRKRSQTLLILELTAVLLVTVLAFAWGMQVAKVERDFNTIGGECVFLLMAAFKKQTGERISASSQLSQIEN